jgi:hypothetical protein
MIFDKKWIIRLVVFNIFVGLVILLPLWSRSPTLAQGRPVSPSQIRMFVLAPNQNIVLKDIEGNEVGNGGFKSKISVREDARTRGQAELDTHGPVKIRFHWDFDGGEATEDGGVLLRGLGRATFEDGNIKTFAAVVKVRKDGATTSKSDRLIWHIFSAPVFGDLNFETERSQLRER